ncbi:hypothetical protein ACHAWF_018491 [Thalassiosira exigua]
MTISLAQLVGSGALLQQILNENPYCACDGCGKIGTDFKQCSACKDSRYCSVACQKNHWRVHKKTCGAKPKLRFSIGDRVRCCRGDWVPWKTGTIITLWADGDSFPYGIMCDDNALIKAPEDHDFCIQKLVEPSPEDRERRRLRDEVLFKESPPEEDCPICCLRLAMSNDTMYMLCCGQTLCKGCRFMSRMGQGKCPYCREDYHSMSDEQVLRKLKDRIKLNDADSFHMLAIIHDRGMHGLSQDSKKAHELWTRAAELGSRDADYNLSKSYSVYYEERGVEKDEKKAIHFLEEAAIRGDAASRCELGRYEGNMGHWDRAKKHCMLSASAGCKSCLGRIKGGKEMGFVTKKEYTKTLRAHTESLEETKSDQREAARAIWTNRDSARPLSRDSEGDTFIGEDGATGGF